MALNLKTIKLIEDIDPTTRSSRLRLEVEELKPRRMLINLKNMTADQINLIRQNQGAVMSFPSAREMIMDGRFLVSFAASDDEIFILKPAETYSVSKVVDLTSVDQTTGEIGVTPVSESADKSANDEKTPSDLKKTFVK